MSGFFSKLGRGETISAIVFAILGIVLIFYPGMALMLMCRFVGIVLAVYGIGQAVSFFRSSDRSFFSTFTFVIGVVLLLFGVYIVARPGTIVSIINFVIAAILFWHGAVDIAEGMTLKSQEYDYWWTALVIGLVTIVLGLIMVLNPFAAAETMTRVIGIFFVCDGISDIWVQMHIA